MAGAGMGWAGLGWAGLGWAGLGLAGLGWAKAGLGVAGLGWDGLSSVPRLPSPAFHVAAFPPCLPSQPHTSGYTPAFRPPASVPRVPPGCLPSVPPIPATHIWLHTRLPSPAFRP